MQWIIDFFRENPELAIFFTLGMGFWIGNIKVKGFSLGVVTSVLLVGVLVGQMDIEIAGPLKTVFFLLFLFAIGYSVGPEFFRSLRSDGIKQVLFAVVLCVICLLVTFGLAKIMNYNIGEAVGLFSGAQTISAVIGVGSSTMSSLNIPSAEKQAMLNIIPVAYAVTYLFGTIGSAYILSVLAPAMLGGIKKVKEQTQELEKKYNTSEIANDPAFVSVSRPVAFRAYKIENNWFEKGQTIKDIEERILNQGRRIYVERVRQNNKIKEVSPNLILKIGDEVVLTGRREAIIEDESWIGKEVNDVELLNFAVENIFVMVNEKTVINKTLDKIRQEKFMHGVIIKRIKRAGVEIPVMAQTIIREGDRLEIIGLEREINIASPKIGYIEKPSNKTDFAFVGLGILIGGIIGSLGITIGSIPISLSVSGGVLIAGLILGWLRTKQPEYGYIPEASLWIMNNLGLNVFIAVIGISSGPEFVAGLKEAGLGLLLAGIVATTIPLILGVFLGHKVFKFHPAINLGCIAGARTTTAALGAIQEKLGSSLPALGYTITYAVGNTLLILWGVVIVLLMA